MWRTSLILPALLAILAGCGQANGGNEPAETGRTKFHMRQHFSDLRTIERMLVAGKLEEAKTLAYMLKSVGDVGQTPETREVALAVGALRTARTIDDAIYAEVRIATACAHCHVAAQKLPVFPLPSRAPADLATIEAQMARHQWAVDRVWEGLVGSSDEHWRAGLYVLATSPLPRTPTQSPQLATQLQKRAQAALDDQSATLEQRGEAYVGLLTTCAACHATSASKPRPR
jgi:cytochrome c553